MKKKEPKWQVLYHTDDRTPVKEITREDAVENPRGAESLYVGIGIKNPKDFTIWKRHYRLMVLGPKIFWKEIARLSLTYKDGKFNGNLDALTEEICRAFKLDWLSTNKYLYRILGGRKDLWKLIISGKVTNPEALLKAVSKRYFGGVYSYKNLKKWCKGECRPCSLWDIYYYTTNPDLTLDMLSSNTYGERDWLFEDSLKMAAFFNEKINAKWSLARLREEHQHQIERKEVKKLEKLDINDIAPAFSKDGLSLILNERECCIEGSKMQNCVYSCYWHQIKDGQYLIARGTVNNEYVDLGIRITGDDVIFNQVHTAYNGRAEEATRDFCDAWIKSNKEELLNIAKYIKEQRKSKVEEISMQWAFEPPF